ncbi:MULTISPECIES: phage regulatory protein/antirepressor Ant [Flavobacterium]|uniref:Phage regulatory protein/antirepressor Ant n=1 Tax=Flavobacterium keumense TaxID=1306518 RepID=A0ABY8N640_9FLAO|nr:MULTISPECIES: phage regulatory protein/antirepressor Ant [Flavobacterium]WGK93762.1 phage regulatory protein/antirepressor Ant [Flavobacterium keumense]
MEKTIINQNKMTSIEIAELTGKLHKNIMQSIREMEPAWEKVNGLKFQLVEYKDSKGQKRPMYELSKSESLYIATKFNDESRAKLIIRWESLELNRSYPANNFLSRKELAMMVIQQEEENERLLLENEKMRPRSEFVDKVFNTEGLVSIGEVAKILGLPYGRNRLFNTLKAKGIFFKNKNEPYQKFVAKGYFKLKEKFQQRNNHPPILIIQTFATQKGLGFIAKELGVVTSNVSRVKTIAS